MNWRTHAAFNQPITRFLLLGLFAVGAFAIWAAFSEPASAQAGGDVPPSESDFSLRPLATGLEQPMAMEVDAEGNIFVIGRCGRFYVWSPTTQTIQQTDAVDVRCDREFGLIGIALDPNFESNRWAYLHYNPEGEDLQRVSRFVLNTNNQLEDSSEIVMLEFFVQSEQCCHQSGDLEFSPDGTLFISVGDNVNPGASDGFTPIDERPGRAPFDAQTTSGNTNDLRGKILRIQPNDDGTYSIPSGNLFQGDSLRRPEIFVMGARNPFRITVDQETGELYWGEVGPDADASDPTRGPAGYDEINRASTAGNYGWPYVSGFNEPYNDYDSRPERPGRASTSTGRPTSPRTTPAPQFCRLPNPRGSSTHTKQ